MMRIKLALKSLFPLFAVIIMAGCGSGDTEVTFTPKEGYYNEPQLVQVALPSGATNVYLTTDSHEPVVNASCSYNGEDLYIDRPTWIKVRYDVNGKTYTGESLYKMELNVQDHGFTNRKVIFSWERFFIKQVLNQIPQHGGVLEDGEGGSVSLESHITTNAAGIPERGYSIYTFNYFEKNDDDTGETLMIKRGTIHGRLDDQGGFYTTIAKEKVASSVGSELGRRIEYGGAYQGWADGDFTMNSAGRTNGGHYTVYCIDNGCADIPVTYFLGNTKAFIEVSPVADEKSRSCQ